jgi:hypothetical protein
MKNISFFFLMGVAFSFICQSSYLFAQDSTYYVEYKDLLTTRVYTSRKYTSLIVNDQLSGDKWKFDPNTTLNLGVGATYNDFTLNLAVGFGFMNPDRGRGESKWLDLQAHAYPKNFVIDFFGQFYTGYYLESNNGEDFFQESILLYPELRVRKFGANFQYLFNGDRLSLKAAFLQSAWQKKSAGSFLVGFEAYGGWANQDGFLIPESQVSLMRNFTGLGFFQFGPNAGYVHTLVFWKRFFITGVLSSNLDLGRSFLELEQGRTAAWGIRPNYFGRIFLGYNSPTWSLNANYVRNHVRLTPVEDFNNMLVTGNYRLNFVYKFSPGPKIQPFLEYIDINRYLPKNKKQNSEN